MTTAAIYARKSTEQAGVADDAKSVTRQIEHATAYATTKGWTVDPAHVYVDDGISGAEFAKHPGLVRLLAALAPRPPFQVLVMSEESRLGREQIETAYLLKQFITRGVRVCYYLEDRERTLGCRLAWKHARQQFFVDASLPRSRQASLTDAQPFRRPRRSSSLIYGPIANCP